MHGSMVLDTRSLGLSESRHGSDMLVFESLKSDMAPEYPICVTQVSCKCQCPRRVRQGYNTYIEVYVRHMGYIMLVIGACCAC